MFEINGWIDRFLGALTETFAERVWFVGLQGSYGRGEATETSDIDMVVILDELSAEDIRAYRAMLDTLPHRELICGFLAGRSQLLRWEPSDLFQFYYDTKPIIGSLDELLPLLDHSAVRSAIKIGVCNLYHGCVHNMLHEKSEEILRGLYKAASFVVQAILFRQTGGYISRYEDLCSAASEGEREILAIGRQLKTGGACEFERMSETLFDWTRGWIEIIK
ncbi:MAG: nucleotidyltransferase domain-containing protein [Clostridia bacterium]|nr:nucleotidyltransferase domain-containing protein [Clostridia bacterium]